MNKINKLKVVYYIIEEPMGIKNIVKRAISRSCMEKKLLTNPVDFFFSEVAR